MDRVGLALSAATALGITAVLRQRREATRVRVGSLAGLGAGGQPDELPTSRVHARIAGWRPRTPATRVGRVATSLWAAPLTFVGLLGSVLGGVRPHPDRERGCLVSRGVSGLPGMFLRGQGATAATIGQVVLSRSHAPSPRLLDHEAVHARQQERLGPLFAIAYPVAGAVWGYRANPFEVAARAGVDRT